MRQSTEKRIAALERANKPPGMVWVPGVSWEHAGRVVAHTPGRWLEPGEPFDYQRVIDDIEAAHAGMEELDWSGGADAMIEPDAQ